MLPNVNLNPLDATNAAANTTITPGTTPTTKPTKKTSAKDSINFSISPSIQILPGFNVPESGSVQWQWSADESTLKFYIHEQQNAQGQTEYVVSFIGTLYYNVALVGLEPIDSAFFVKPNTATPIAFTSHGAYHINEVIGTYASVADIQQLDLCNFLVTNVVNSVVAVDNEGTTHTVDLNDPNSLRQLIDEFGILMFVGNHSVTISYQNPPIS